MCLKSLVFTRGIFRWVYRIFPGYDGLVPCGVLPNSEIDLFLVFPTNQMLGQVNYPG